MSSNIFKISLFQTHGTSGSLSLCCLWKLIRQVAFKIIPAILILTFSPPDIIAQKLDVAYVPTPPHIVDEMLEIADVGPGDYVIDLGCGDGRIVIAAAKRGAYGHGVDLDPQRIKNSRENAFKAEVEDRVVFVQENIYETDFSNANVITMYLFPTINIKLRPDLLKKLKPGSRLVSHDFSMDEWKADKHIQTGDHHIYFWIIPANISGNWAWKVGEENYSMIARQEFQEIDLDIKSGTMSLNADDCILSGKRISFTFYNPNTGVRHVYSGEAEGNNIKGIVQIHNNQGKVVKNWSAILE
jgi:SAM-dependent methyltransferase